MEHSQMHQHYRTLGLQAGCSLDEVRARYKELAKSLHPDRQGPATASASTTLAAFQAVQAAYAELTAQASREGQEVIVQQPPEQPPEQPQARGRWGSYAQQGETGPPGAAGGSKPSRWGPKVVAPAGVSRLSEAEQPSHNAGWGSRFGKSHSEPQGQQLELGELPLRPAQFNGGREPLRARGPQAPSLLARLLPTCNGNSGSVPVLAASSQQAGTNASSRWGPKVAVSQEHTQSAGGGAARRDLHGNTSSSDSEGEGGGRLKRQRRQESRVVDDSGTSGSDSSGSSSACTSSSDSEGASWSDGDVAPEEDDDGADGPSPAATPDEPGATLPLSLDALLAQQQQSAARRAVVLAATARASSHSLMAGRRSGGNTGGKRSAGGNRSRGQTTLTFVRSKPAS